MWNLASAGDGLDAKAKAAAAAAAVGSRSGLESRHDAARLQSAERKRKAREGMRDREAEEVAAAADLLQKYLDETLSWESSDEEGKAEGRGLAGANDALAKSLFESQTMSVSLLPGGPPLVFASRDDLATAAAVAASARQEPSRGATARPRVSARPRAIAEDADAVLLNASDSDSGSDAAERQRRKAALLDGCVWEPEGPLFGKQVAPTPANPVVRNVEDEEERGRKKKKEKEKKKRDKKDKKVKKDKKRSRGAKELAERPQGAGT